MTSSTRRSAASAKIAARRMATDQGAAVGSGCLTARPL
jgi:hypothetical protein